MIFANLYLLRCHLSCRITISPTLKFLCGSLHFCLFRKVTRNSFRHRLQNLLLMCLILLHLLRQHRSGLPNTPVGGITTLYFIVKMWLGDIFTLLLTLLIVSTTIGLELTLASTSENKVLSDSLSWLILFVLTRDERTVLADLICLYHTPPIWLAIGGFFFYTIQSDFSFRFFP